MPFFCIIGKMNCPIGKKRLIFLRKGVKMALEFSEQAYSETENNYE